MTTQELDQFLLASVDHHWQKIAMVVARALTDQDLEFPGSVGDAAFIATRLDELKSRGLLEVQGDSSNWRFSEVRRIVPSTGAA